MQPDQQLAGSMAQGPNPQLQALLQGGGMPQGAPQGAPQAPQGAPAPQMPQQPPMPPQAAPSAPQEPQMAPHEQETQMIIKALISHMTANEKRLAFEQMARTGMTQDGQPLNAAA